MEVAQACEAIREPAGCPDAAPENPWRPAVALGYAFRALSGCSSASDPSGGMSVTTGIRSQNPARTAASAEGVPSSPQTLTSGSAVTVSLPHPLKDHA